MFKYVKRGVNSGTPKGKGGAKLKKYVRGGRTMARMAFFAKLNSEGLYESNPAKRNTNSATSKLKATRKRRTSRDINTNRTRALKYLDDMSTGLGTSVTPTKDGGKLFKGQGSSKSKWDRNVRTSKTSSSTSKFKEPRDKVGKKTTRYTAKGNQLRVTKSKPLVNLKTGKQTGTRKKTTTTTVLQRRKG